MKSAFKDSSDGSSALSSGIADLMTSLAVSFFLLLAAHVTRVEESSAKPPTPASAVTTELEHRLEAHHLAVETRARDPHVLSVVVPDAILNFELGESTLLPSADMFLEAPCLITPP